VTQEKQLKSNIPSQSEIPKLLSNSTKAKKLLKWEPEISLEDASK